MQNLEAVDVNSSGQLKRDFELVDEAGRSISCSAQNLQAKSTTFAENDVVVLYYGTGRRAGQNGAFVVYIYRDGFVAKIGTMNPPPSITEKVMAAPGSM